MSAVTDETAADVEVETAAQPDTEIDGSDQAAGDMDSGPVERCEAETTVGGTLYRCALGPEHEGEHSFSPVDADTEAPEPAGDSDREQAKALRALENEAIRHNKRVQEIMGPDASSLIQCELCPPNIPGWRFDVAPDEDRMHRVRAAIGLPSLETYKMSATEHMCNDCQGLGKVKTGSLVAKYETATCDACGGKGYAPTRPRQNTEAAPEVPSSDANGGAQWHDDGVQRDMFGTPITDPDYGLMPNMRQRPTDYWQTHRE